MANNTRKPWKVQDQGVRLVFDGKSQHMRRGGKFLSDSPSFFDHELYEATTYTESSTAGPFNGIAIYTSTGTAVVNPTILAVGASNVTGGAGGVLEFTTDDVQNSAEEYATPLLYEFDVHAPLTFETRLKFRGAASSTEATRELFFGLCDRTTSTSGRAYTVTTASAITGTNVPADFVGFAMSGVPTSGIIFNTDIDGAGTDGTNVGYITSINSVDLISVLQFTGHGASSGVTGPTPTVGTTDRFVMNAAGTTGAINDATAFHVYRIDVDIDGIAKLFVDGKFGGKTTALRNTIPMCAYFDVVTLTASGANTSAILDVDYVYVGASSNWKA